MTRRAARFAPLWLLLALAACGGEAETRVSPGNTEPEPDAAQVGGGGAIRTVDLCLSMRGGEDRVAAMQVDVEWDPTCMSPTVRNGASASCTVEPRTGKDVHSRIEANWLRAIVLSLTNVDPIPDGELFCCSFKTASDSCCALNLDFLLASDSDGMLVDEPEIVYDASLDGVPCASEVAGSL
jgi:hypothetical protein